jgi:His-Xaa-Ser system protein HxsD
MAMQDVDVGPRGVVISFDKETTSLDVLQRAAIRLSGLCSFVFETKDAAFEVKVEPLSELSIDLGQLEAKYRSEVLDQALRERIARETEQERNLILAYAFSNTKLIGQ